MARNLLYCFKRKIHTMEFHINTTLTEDAEDLFLIAKDRLLDINEWNNLLSNKAYSVSLTDTKGQKAHRNARMYDLIKISDTNSPSPEKWVQISHIQYDNFPDINSESISLLLELSNNDHKSLETILLKRENTNVTIHCNGGNELPEIDDATPNDHLITDKEQHPILNLPNNELQQLLQRIITY